MIDRGRISLGLVQAGLVRWGEYQIKTGAISGYPPESPLARIFQGGTCPRPRDRILVPDRPGDVAKIHRAWLSLVDIYREAVSAKYATPLRADGTVLTDREVAGYLGVSLSAFRVRVTRAKQMIRLELAGY